MRDIEEVIPFLVSTTLMCLLATIILYIYIKRLSYAFIISFSKYFICAIYFLVWNKFSPIVLLDDQTYYEQSKVIFEQAGGSMAYLFSFESIAYIASIAGGTHFGYYIYNFLSFFLFGQHYYSPVILNILFSIITAIILYKTLLMVGIEKKFAMFFLAFFSLHWDLITWSSFINLKDILVLFFTVWALNCMIQFRYTNKTLIPAISLFLISGILLFFRFYLVYFLAVTGVIYFVVLQMYRIKSNWFRLFIRFLILILLPIAFYVSFIRLFSSSLADVGGTTNVGVGFIRFILTPFPFTIEENYSFLLISSLLHWFCLPLLFYGFYLFLKRYFISLMPLLILSLLLCIFYGSFAELQGPRHRVVLLYFITLLQALSIFELLKILINPPKKICAEYLEHQ